MKRHLFLTLISLLTAVHATAISNNYVEIAYNGTTATVTVASNIKNYITVQSGTSSHVSIVQSSSVGLSSDEIYYKLSGTTTDGEFYLEGTYKCTVILNGVTITNPSGPAVNIQNGKRIDISLTNNTTSTLADGANELYKGCFHCKGHTRFKGRGTLNVIGNSHHAIYSKEFVEMKNCTINVLGAVRDGIHCQQYFLMENPSTGTGATVSIKNVGDDGIEVEIKGETPTEAFKDHEDPTTEEAENTGNFYMEAGTLTISGYADKVIKTYGTVHLTGGTCNFSLADIAENVMPNGIYSVGDAISGTPSHYFTLDGKHISQQAMLPGRVFIVRKGNKSKKIVKH